MLYEDSDGPIFEKFERSSFESCDMSDIILQYDHSGKVFARKSNGSLIVEIDDTGIFMCADLSRSQSAKDLYQEISNGLITKMSWGFLPGDASYDRKTRTLTYTKIKKIFDVSAVSIPANDNTNIFARNFVSGEIDKVMQELQKREKLKKQLLLKLKLEGVK